MVSPTRSKQPTCLPADKWTESTPKRPLTGAAVFKNAINPNKSTPLSLPQLTNPRPDRQFKKLKSQDESTVPQEPVHPIQAPAETLLQAFIWESKTWIDQRDINKASETIEMGLSKFPNEVQLLNLKISLMKIRHDHSTIEVVLNRIKSGYFSEASNILNKYFEEGGSDYYCYYLYGFVSYKLGNHELAISAYRSALKINPEFVNAKTELASTLCLLEKFDEALMLINDLIQFEPLNVNHYQLKCSIQSEQIKFLSRQILNLQTQVNAPNLRSVPSELSRSF